MADPKKVTVTGRYTGGAIWSPKVDKQGKARCAAVVVLDPGQADLVRRACEAARKEEWADRKPPGYEEYGVRVGDDPEFDLSYEREFIRPKSTRPPKVLRKVAGHPVDVTDADDVLYPGCLVAVSVNAYAYKGSKDDGIKPGVSLNLRAVMFRGHADRLSDHVDPDAEFDGVQEVEGDAMPDDDSSFLNA